MSGNYENFLPRKVYSCLCLMHIVNEIYDANIFSYSLILETISKSCIAPKQVFSLCMENKMSCMLMHQVHLILTSKCIIVYWILPVTVGKCWFCSILKRRSKTEKMRYSLLKILVNRLSYVLFGLCCLL